MLPQSACLDCGNSDIRRTLVQILYKDKNMIAVYKAPGVPSQSDPIGDKDAMTEASQLLSETGERGELWLVHRLDRVVGGVLIFARSKRCAAQLSELIAANKMEKEYLAVVDGIPEEGILTDLLFKDSARTKAFVVDRMRSGVKEARLESRILKTEESERGTRTLTRIKLHTGRFHQIRVQLSSRGTPITGDGKYGSRDGLARTPALFAFHLGFTLDKKRYDIYKYPDVTEYPWSEFEKVISELKK